MDTKHYQFQVALACSGCVAAVEKALAKLQPDISKFDISLEKQIVDVYTSLPIGTVLDKLQKTGKKVSGGTELDN
ncbi:copper metallochaperone ATX1 Ecym_1125 [Eremothecium cymbalariae DBVPG|uniref:HMA domain-containing protein n=1 Tax=Eremothecium cymbalariae (strain CBS 270.75 / DBVPG 7215 / KCTC 17166 / NRRL Y-17582) TaxID=931890 RepID=G8JMM3_ERECY|nr:hypothetical protein Ecym_1125 [Eremothecium cymbalariae DBVPG\